MVKNQAMADAFERFGEFRGAGLLPCPNPPLLVPPSCSSFPLLLKETSASCPRCPGT